MPLVPAICTQCGAAIEVDNSQEAAVCKYCGTPFIVEKAIHQYTTNVTNHNNFAGANVQINMNSELEQLIAAAEGFEKLEELFQASKKYTEVTEKYPQDVRGWLGKLRTDDSGRFFRAELADDDDAYNNSNKWFWYGDTVDFERTEFAHVYKNAYLLADAATKAKLEEAKENYVNAIKRDIEKARKEVSPDTLKALIKEGDFCYYFQSMVHLYPQIHMFNRDDKLYYQYVNRQPTEDGKQRTDVKTYEIVAIDENGVMYGKHRLGFYPDIQLQLYNTDYRYPNYGGISYKTANDRYPTH